MEQLSGNQNLMENFEKQSKIERLCSSRAFIYAVAVVVLILHCLALDIYGIVAFAFISAVFLVCFKDFRPALTMMLSVVFIVSTQNSPGYGVGVGYYQRPDVINWIYISASAILLGFIINTIRNFKNLKGSYFAIPIGLFAVSWLVGGYGGQYYKESFLFELIGFAFYFLLFIFFFVMIDEKKNILDYVCDLFSALALVVALEIIYVYILNIILKEPIPGIGVGGGRFDWTWKSKIITGWGVSNIAGELLLFFSPFLFRNIYTRKFYCFYVLEAFIVLIAHLMTLNKTGIFVGVVMYPVLAIRVFVKCNDRKRRGVTSCIIVFACVVAGLIAYKFSNLLNVVFQYFDTFIHLDDTAQLSHRENLWKHAVAMFKENPIFGGGILRNFLDGYKIDTGNPFQALYHNIVFQMMGTSGIIGLTTLAVLTIYTVKLFFAKKEGRFESVCFGIAFFVVALFDTVYYIPYSVMFYVLICVMNQKQVRTENPRFRLFGPRKKIKKAN